MAHHITPAAILEVLWVYRRAVCVKLPVRSLTPDAWSAFRVTPSWSVADRRDRLENGSWFRSCYTATQHENPGLHSRTIHLWAKERSSRLLT